MADRAKRLPAPLQNPKISFPLSHKVVRPISKSLKTTFKYKRPCTSMF
jgi:hypothetical protein